MSESINVATKAIDSVNIADITRILKEEGFFDLLAVPPDSTFGQARGIAGRRYTQVIRRLGELGFTAAPRDTGLAAGPPGGSHIHCYVAWFWGMPYIACDIYIAF